MVVPDLLVIFVFVLDCDEVGDIGLGESVMITEALDGVPELILVFISQRLRFVVVSGIFGHSAKVCRSEKDSVEERR